tara:strand:- start:1626 stop:2612 length:987 start_codon:yes stop_codon:yes gene_type:complete
MRSYIYLGYFFLGLSSSLLILKNGIRFFEKFFLDNPNKRSLHLKPVPSAGGLSFIIPLLLYDLIFAYFNNFKGGVSLSLLCIPLIGISFLDDLIKVSPKYRYLFQLFTALLILGFSNINLFLLNPIFNIFIFIFLVIFITGSINFTNFMDGSDGLVAGCMFVFFLIINYKLNSNISIIILLGSLAAFIYWNWNPAKIFMGDIGSTFLGVYFAANILQFNEINEIVGLLLIASPFFGDALITVLRRFFKRQNIFKAHRQHLYQRLYLGKLSKQQVAIIYILQSLMIGIVYIKLNFIYEIGTIFASFFIMFILEKKYAVSFEQEINNKLI